LATFLLTFIATLLPEKILLYAAFAIAILDSITRVHLAQAVEIHIPYSPVVFDLS
jgi:hypothetical protein